MEKVPVSPIAGTPHPGFFVCCEHTGTRFPQTAAREKCRLFRITIGYPILSVAGSRCFPTAWGPACAAVPLRPHIHFPPARGFRQKPQNSPRICPENSLPVH